MKVQILSHTKDPELLIATAAKLCYAGCDINALMQKQTPEGIQKFISMLEELGHESPMEHVSFTFAIEGVSRVTEQQLTRHRIASYSIQSGRYVNRSNADFYIPNDIKNCEKALEIYSTQIEESKNAYENISKHLIYHYILEDQIENGKERYIPDICKGNMDLTIDYYQANYKSIYNPINKKAIENARMVFPNSLETKIICTMNVRTLLNFFKHRCCFRAQEEIRMLAKEMLKEVKIIAPTLFKHAGPSCVTGICPEGKMQCKELKGKIPNNIEVKQLIKEFYTDEWKTNNKI